MKCVTKDNTLTYLVNNNYINDLRAITGNDVDKFNIINKKLTEHGKIKYGLMPAPGELLFSVDTEKHKKPVNTSSKAYISNAAYDTTYRAVPNDLLFEALQDSVNAYDEKYKESRGLTDISEEIQDESDIELVFSSAYGDNGYNLDIIKDGTKVGTVNYELDNGIARVGAVKIDEAFQKQGLATEAYITLGDSLANQDIALRSGELNSLSKGLWNKLVDQGKAQMIDKNVYEYSLSKTTYYQLNNKDIFEPALEELDKYLLDFLKPFGVKSKEFNELKSKLGVDALGATDILNKLIWYSKNRNAETVPEEVGHMVTMLMGETNPLIKDLLESITDWSEYDKIYKQYMPIYNNVKQVKIEAVGKLIAKSLVKNYKASGTDKTLLKKALAAIEEFIEKIFGAFKNNLIAQMQYSENIADHIAINILMGDKNYIAKLDTSFKKLDYDTALKNNKFAQSIIDIFTKMDAKLTGSLAIAGQGDIIYRSSEEPIHDVDFTVKNKEDFEDILDKVESMNGVPAHYGWSNKEKQYTTYAYIIPLEGLTVEVLERDFNRGNGWVTQFNLRDKNGNIVEKTKENHMPVDFFVYNDGTDASKTQGIFKSTANVYLGKATLSTAKERMFTREKDQKDYVLHKSSDLTDSLPEFTYYQLKTLTKEEQFLKLDAEVSQKARATEVAEILADRLSKNLKTSYQIITEAEAKQILKNRVISYNGEPAFFFGGIVYFVGDNFNLETALHEFGHPLIGAIRVENVKLFNNLFTQVKSTTEGQAIIEKVQRLYPELEINSPLFMEEVIVHALQQTAYNKVTNTPESEGFVKFIKNVLYSIKQFFRSFFSNTQNISKINESTTLGELADMMLSKDFEYQTDLVTNEDIAMFSRYTNARVKILTKNVSENAMQSAIDNFYASTSSMLNSAKRFSKKSNLYPMLQKTLFIEGTNELLPAIKKSLTPYQSIVDTGKASKDEIIEEVIESELRRMRDMTNKSINFVSSLEITNNIIKNIYKDLLDIQKDKNFGERSTLSVLGIYRTNLSNYIEFVDDTVELFKEDFNLDSSNALSNLLSEMNTNAKSAISLLQKIYKDSSVDFYRTYTAYMQEFLDDKLKKDLGNALKNKLTAEELEDFYDKVVSGNITDEDMAKVIAKGVEKKYINDFISEYNYLKIDELKLRDILSGNAKDVSWFNRFLESYTSSNDPIVGGLAMYIQNIKTDAQLKTLNETEVFRGKLEPILKANNINYNNTAQVAELISNRDEVLGYDEKGEAVKKEVFTLKNEWKGYRYEQAKLQNDYSKALETNDKEVIATAAAALKQFKKDYMYDKYTKIVLDADDIFNESPVHRLAWLTRKQALEDYNSELSIFSTELERFEKYSSAQALWRKYQQLYELSYIDGSPKVDDPENNIYDLSIALILREHKEKTSDFYESVVKEGSLQTSYNEFINSIIAEGVSKEVFNEMNAKWIRQNTRVAYSETYYTRKKELITRLKELQDKKTDKSEFNIGEAFSEIYDLLFSFRDSQGQPIPSELKAERIQKIKELQQKINDSKFAEQKTSKLTKAQASELNEYINIIKSKTETLSDEQKLRYLKLIKENTPDGLTALESAEIQGIYSELAEISSKIPTEYYMETMNYYLTQILGKGETSETTVDDLINSESFKDLLSDDTKFRNWFFNNHVTKKRYSRTGDIDIYFERLACYSVSVPNNEEDYIKTKLINPQTGAEFTINGLPNSRHTEFRIKNDPKYRTIPIGEDWKNYIGTIKDNAGNYLPRPYKKGETNSAKDDRFVDYDYLKLKAANNDQYKLIETIKEYYIKFQNEAAVGSRLWYDLPRYGKKGMLENLQAGALSDKAKALKGSWDYYWQKMIGKSNDDYELGLNYDAQKNLVTTDMQGNEISYVPVTGTYNLDIEKTSKDFLPGIFQYIQSINMQAKLIESAPLLNSILSVLEDPKNGLKNINKQSRTINKITGKLVNVNKNKGDTYNRLEQVRSLVERELYGRKIVGIEESNPWLHKMSNFMLSAAGRATLAINVPSDLKNRYGQIVQNLIEASGGKYVSLKSMALARPWAAKTMLEWSAVGIYTRGNQSLNSQLIQSFDAFFKTEKQFGENLSRTRAKDTLDGSWMYSFRKFGEMEAAMQLFGGFMHHQYVDQITSTGKAVPIRYIDAWELDKDGVLTLKKGINPEWGNKTIYHTVEATDTLESISEKYSIPLEELKAKNSISKNENLIEGNELVIAQSVKFKQFKNKFQTISRRLYGVYDDFGQAEGNKYFIYRMFYFMRKWTTSLFTNRFGADLSKENRWGRRYDWGLGETSRGYYISGIVSLYKLVKSAGKYYPYMSEEDKIDTKKMISEGVSIFLFSVLGGLLFGYDPDDEERWEKIKKRSDAFGTEGFKANGWIANHMLNLLLQVGAETSAFVPLPGLGFDDYNNFISVTSASFGSTLTLYAKIIEDLFMMVTGKDAAYYKIESGPYSWQKEGQAKIKSHILKTIGITGRTGDVETLIKNYERYSSKI
jgi:LysM repeat protein